MKVALGTSVVHNWRIERIRRHLDMLTQGSSDYGRVLIQKPGQIGAH